MRDFSLDIYRELLEALQAKGYRLISYRDHVITSSRHDDKYVILRHDVDAKPENSYQPYQAYIYNGRYPIVRTVYALLNDPRRGLPWGFAHFIESYKGQLIIKKSGIQCTSTSGSLKNG